MNSDLITFAVLGARGGRPAFGQHFRRFGGHTTCYAVDLPEALIVFDAGSGILSLNDVVKSWNQPKPISIIFTHFHLDHVAGLAAFDALYEAHSQITLYGADPHPDHPWRDTLNNLIGEPYWPVSLSEVASRVDFVDLDTDLGVTTVHGLRLHFLRVPHSQACLAFRIDLPGGSTVIATDHEAALGDRAEFLEFCQGADLLIHDAQYTPEEYPAHRGWGHSTWKEAAEIARDAAVQRLVLTHHDPLRTDDQIDAMVAAAQGIFPNTRGAVEGLQYQYRPALSALETSVSP